MANLANLARMFSETNGQGTVTVTSAVPGFIAFDDVLTDGLTYSYGIEADYQLFDGVPIAQAREVGRGVWDATANTLTRASNIRSTDGDGVKLTLVGDSEVFICALEEDFVTLGGGTYQIKTSAGGVTVAVKNSLIILNKTVGAATAVELPVASTKLGPVLIKDLKGDLETNNATVTVASAGTIDGSASKIMRSNYECRGFYPMPDGTNAYIITI